MPRLKGSARPPSGRAHAGLTLIRPRFRNVPTAIAIEPGFPDELWVKDARMEDISGPAVIISLENSPRTEINMENVVCSHVPTFASSAKAAERYRRTGAPVRRESVFARTELRRYRRRSADQRHLRNHRRSAPCRPPWNPIIPICRPATPG